MHHGHLRAGGSGDGLQLGTDLGQGLLQDDHRKDRGARGHVAGALAHGIGGHHAGLGVALGRAQRDAGLQLPGHVQQLRACLGESSGVLARHQHRGQDVPELPGEALVRHQGVELFHHLLVEVVGGRVDREHAGALADAQHLFAGELPVHEALQGGHEADVGHVGLAVQDGLVQMGDGPALGDVEVEQPGQLLRGLAGNGVAPGAEGHQQLILFIEHDVAVHHGGKAHGSQLLHAAAVLGLHVPDHVGIAVLQAGDDVLQVVGPDVVDQLVLPVVRALRDGGARLVDQHGLDAGGAELHAQARPAALDGGANLIDAHVNHPPCVSSSALRHMSLQFFTDYHYNTGVKGMSNGNDNGGTAHA